MAAHWRAMGDAGRSFCGVQQNVSVVLMMDVTCLGQLVGSPVAR
jgi:hypothetical protein